MASRREERSDQIKKRIEQSMHIANEQHQQKLSRQRLEVARAAVSSARQRQFPHAVKSYLTYIRLVEELKNVPVDGLMPSHFDLKKDLGEMLMLSGVYWELARLFDKSTVVEREKDFFKYLEKFVVFSKGMSFENLCAETLRKYIRNDRPRHKIAFKNAYRTLTGSSCFVVTSLIDLTSDDALPVLRDFRDQFLSQFSLGRRFIRWYYQNGPQIAKSVDGLPDIFRVLIAMSIDGLAIVIRTLKNWNRSDL